MDDIDRTFEALKRTEFRTVRAILESQQIGPFIVNPVTFGLHVHKIFHPMLARYGWTAEDFENKLNKYDE